MTDFSANYYNPAGLALAQGMEISVGYFRADHYLYMNGQNSGVDPVKGTVGGAVVPGKALRRAVRLRRRVPHPGQLAHRASARFLRTSRDGSCTTTANQRLWFGVERSRSARTPWLQLGGGVTFMAATTARSTSAGTSTLRTPTHSHLRHEVDANVTLIALPGSSARAIEATKDLSFALVYRGQFKEHLVVNANVHAGGGIAAGHADDAQPRPADRQVDAFLPQQVVLGTSWKPTDDLRLEHRRDVGQLERLRPACLGRSPRVSTSRPRRRMAGARHHAADGARAHLR